MAILWKKDGVEQATSLFENEAAYATATNKLVNIFTKANVAATDAGEENLEVIHQIMRSPIASRTIDFSAFINQC